MERLFLASKTYGLLCDPETGLYSDNVLVTADLFLREAAPALYTQEELTAQPYFKYRSLTAPYTKEIFEKRELWYSAPKDFNDPFDCNLPLNCDDSSVLCFSLIGDSIPLFSYYADGHKGICIEFSFSILDMPSGISLAQQMFVRNKIIPLGVDYSDKFPALNINKLYLYHDPRELARNLIGVKAECWDN
jgi:hypothetical protein